MKRGTSTAMTRVIALVFFFTVPSLALAQKGVLEVTCVDQANQPIAGMRVFVQKLGTNEVKSRKSNRDGIAAFKGLSEGYYRVLGRKKGFEPALYEYVEVKGGAEAAVTLTCKPGDSEKKLYFEDQELIQRAFNKLREGVDLLRAKKFAEAEKILKESLAINPSNPDTQRNLAIAYIQQRKWAEAEQALAKAVKLYGIELALLPKDSPNLNLYQQSYDQAKQLLEMMPIFRLGTEADQALRERRFDEAIAKYREVIKLQPNNADNYYNLAVALANSKRYDEAVEAVDKGLTLKPGDKGFLELKRRILNNKEAEILNRAKAMLAAGDKLYNAGQYEAALEKYEAARPLVPQKVLDQLYVQEARAHAKLNHIDEAIKAYRQAIELAPDKSNYWQELAQLYLTHGQYGEGMRVYVEMYEHQSAPVDQELFALGKKFLADEKPDLAAAAFQKVLEVNPQFAEAYYQLGMHYFYDKKDKARAKQMLQKYLQLGKNPKNLEDAKAVLAVIGQ